MKLTYYSGAPPNFGDEINATIWSHLLPSEFLDDDDSELFLGIGSILWDYLPKTAIKHVIGSGDSAILLRETPLPEKAAGNDIAFMPHFQSATRGNWEKACALAGITYLDPREDTQELLARIRGAKLLISEAMHGAIVADALRTPWIGIVPFIPLHRAKWADWAASLEIPLRRVQLRPSNLLEAYSHLTGLSGQGWKSNSILRSRLAAPASSALCHIAARHLTRLAETVEPQLSSDAAITRATEGFAHR